MSNSACTTDRLVVCGIRCGFEDPSHPPNKSRTTTRARPEVESVVEWLE
ncbi:hypothetical protein [Variovorax sp. WS11]|nr:hypothetical protein [Variovorax sp. WS11]NDZ18916.1 hypothetical protein [Variovorax sp. WS11]